jgi:large subunit ribosomal protein L3
MPEGLLGRKIGMTSVYLEGDQIPVTVIEVEPNPLVQVKSEDGPDGYTALQLAYGTKKKKRVTKPLGGHYAKADVEPKKVLREFRDMVTDKKAGDVIGIEDIFAEGDLVHVRGRSKGRGYAGVVKRHGFHGHKASHGTHESFRGPGSIGSSAWPARVFKGVRMAGRMGNTNVFVKNLEIIEILADKNLVLVSGAVPGARNSIVELLKA